MKQQHSLFVRAIVSLVVVAGAILGLTARSAQAGIEPRAILETYFETGDVPTAEQFGSLIDSMVTYADDLALLGLKNYDPSHSYALGDTVIYSETLLGASIAATPGDFSDLRAVSHDVTHNLHNDFAGHLGFLGIVLGDTLGNHYYGFLQLSMESSPGSNPLKGPAIDVQYVVWESTPDTAITVFAVPEPTGMAVVMIGATIAGAMRRRRSR